jgi:hypothetical protein
VYPNEGGVSEGLSSLRSYYEFLKYGKILQIECTFEGIRNKPSFPQNFERAPIPLNIFILNGQ